MSKNHNLKTNFFHLNKMKFPLAK